MGIISLFWDKIGIKMPQKVKIRRDGDGCG